MAAPLPSLSLLRCDDCESRDLRTCTVQTLSPRRRPCRRGRRSRARPPPCRRSSPSPSPALAAVDSSATPPTAMYCTALNCLCLHARTRSQKRTCVFTACIISYCLHCIAAHRVRLRQRGPVDTRGAQPRPALLRRRRHLAGRAVRPPHPRHGQGLLHGRRRTPVHQDAQLHIHPALRYTELNTR